MSDEYSRVQAAAAFVREQIPAAPGIAIGLGSGLGDFAGQAAAVEIVAGNLRQRGHGLAGRRLKRHQCHRNPVGRAAIEPAAVGRGHALKPVDESD